MSPSMANLPAWRVRLVSVLSHILHLLKWTSGCCLMRFVHDYLQGNSDVTSNAERRITDPPHPNPWLGAEADEVGHPESRPFWFQSDMQILMKKGRQFRKATTSKSTHTKKNRWVNLLNPRVQRDLGSQEPSCDFTSVGGGTVKERLSSSVLSTSPVTLSRPLNNPKPWLSYL